MKRLGAGVLSLLLLLVGCTGGKADPPDLSPALKRVEQKLGIPIRVEGYARFPQGSDVAIIAYEKEGECGTAAVRATPLGSEESEFIQASCRSEPGIPTGTHFADHWLYIGRRGSEEIVRVVAKWPDGYEVEMRLGPTRYYAFAPEPPRDGVVEWTAYNNAGKAVPMVR